MARLDDLELIEPPSRQAWRTWLSDNHDTSAGVWLAIGKKGGTVTSLTYDDAVEEALCFGWIDSTVRRLDEHRFKQLLTPRRPASIWAKSNKERVARLERDGLMQPAGRAVIEAAIADGSWILLDEVEALTIPDDLGKAFATSPAAKRGYDALSDSARKQTLYWILSAKRPGTRATRIAATVEAAERGLPPR